MCCCVSRLNKENSLWLRTATRGAYFLLCLDISSMKLTLTAFYLFTFCMGWQYWDQTLLYRSSVVIPKGIFKLCVWKPSYMSEKKKAWILAGWTWGSPQKRKTQKEWLIDLLWDFLEDLKEQTFSSRAIRLGSSIFIWPFKAENLGVKQSRYWRPEPLTPNFPSARRGLFSLKSAWESLYQAPPPGGKHKQLLYPHSIIIVL